MGNIISVRRSTTDYFYHYDRMGNVLFLTDTAGNKVAEYLLDSYGNIAYSQGASVNSYLWRTLPYDSSLESYQQAGSIYSSKNNKLLNAGYRQQQSAEDIPEDRINFICGWCEKITQINSIRRRINRIKEIYLGVMYENSLSGEAVASTSCWGRKPLMFAKIHWKHPWGSDESCLNVAAKCHEQVHCEQCRNNGWSWWIENYSPSTPTWIKWNEVELTAYKTEASVLNNMLLNQSDKIYINMEKVAAPVERNFD
jgi:hypothetical protein